MSEAEKLELRGIQHDYHRCHCDQWGRCLVHCDTCHCGEAGRHVYAGLNERGYSSWKWVPDVL